MKLEVEKDESITDFISRLEMEADCTLVQFVDYWDSDLCAIGIKRENRLVYVSTFNGKDNYYYELELFDDIEVDKFTVLQQGDGVAENVLISIIKEYLKI
jgi:hypothetical protein